MSFTIKTKGDDSTNIQDNKNRVVAKLDIVFKTIFSDEKNMDLLKDLVRVFLDIDEEGEYSIASPELLPVTMNEKFSLIDLQIKTKTSNINVEVQLGSQMSFKKRSLLYWAKLCTSSLQRGVDYSKLRPCHTLNILDFTLFHNEPDFFNKFTLYNKNHTENFGELMNLAYVELPKLKNISAEDIRKDNRLAWGLFFKAEEEEEFKMLADKANTPAIQKAVNVIEQMRKDEQMREIARVRWFALVAEQMEKDAARTEGIEVGRKEGIEVGIKQGIEVGRKEGIEVGIKQGKEGEHEKFRQYFKSQGKTDEEIDAIFRGLDNHE